MAFKFFENAISSGAQQRPNEMYRDLQQEFVNLQWDNTSTLLTIEEQDSIGSCLYKEIEVWIDSIVADTTTGLKDSRDFCKLIFKDINHRVVRGLMYKFDNNYWLVNNYSQYSGVVQQCGVRRCNNFLRIIDPLNGAVQSIPCCIDYDMASPSQQTSKYIITPNNHAVVMVQGNELTSRLLKTNTRYMLSGRPFKLLAYQNAVEYGIDYQQDTLLYLDMYLDEIHDKDDIIQGIADNGEYNYSININSKNMNLVSGSVGKLKADVVLNGKEVNRKIFWKSSNPNLVTISQDGDYVVTGSSGNTVVLSAEIEGNKNISSSVVINIVEDIYDAVDIVVEPSFKKIRQYESIDFIVQAEYNGETYTNFDSIEVKVNDNDRQYVNLIKNLDGTYTLTALKISSDIVAITVNVQCLMPTFEATKIFEISTVSMMG